MNEASEDPLVAQARKMMLWLCFECPLGGNPQDCQAHAIRNAPFPERRRWVADLSGEECLRVYDCHLRCEARKEEARRAEGTAS